MSKKSTFKTLAAGFTSVVLAATTFTPMVFAKPGDITYGVEHIYTQVDGKTTKHAEKDKTVKVLADEGYEFKDLSVKRIDEPCKNKPQDEKCKIKFVSEDSFKMDGEVLVSATVTKKKTEYTITVNSNDETIGTVSVDGDLTKSVAGETIYINAFPINENYQVTWKSDDVEIDYPIDLGASFEMPKKDVVITAVFEKLAIIEETTQSWIQGSEKGLTFLGNGHFKNFEKGGSVIVDGNTLGEENFVAEEGSTKVTLTPEFLATLNTGKHSLSLTWDTGMDKKGSAETTFIVLPETPTPTPITPTEEKKEEKKTVAPDTSSFSPALLFAIAAVLILGGTFVAKRANKA